MKILLKNRRTVPIKFEQGAIVAVATTVVELDEDLDVEEWSNARLRQEVCVSHLPPDQQERVFDVLAQVSSALSTGEFDVGKAKVKAHSIQLTDETPIYQKPRRFPEPVNEEIERQCIQMRDLGITENSTSPWSSPVVPVLKPDGTMRICIDYRRLNAQTKPDRSPIPCLSDAVYGVQGRKFFTTLDLVKGYHQIPLSEDSRECTAFSTAYAHYQFKRMPFGLRNAPAAFQREIQQVLREFPRKNVVVYFDDILIMEDSFETHLALVSKVLHTLARHSIKVKPSKCQWVQSKVSFLGHTVSAAWLRKQEDYVKKVDDFPRPATVRELQQFRSC